MQIADRVRRLDWVALERMLSDRGYAKTAPVLTPAECDRLQAMYSDAARFRSRIDMARYRFGMGEYKYFAAPLPGLVEDLRTHAYPPLSAIANRWMEMLGSSLRYPPTLASFLESCAAQGQVKPTPLLLRYEEGGYNCLHQDVYGDLVFPFQMVALLSRRGDDFTGGEFLLVEQRPRAQSVGEAIVIDQGEIVIFTTRVRPVAGSRGHYRVNVRHGISRVRSGQRYALGVIFHNAR